MPNSRRGLARITVAHLRSLTESEALRQPPIIREHDGGITRCWLEDGEVRSRDIAAADLREPGGGLPALETLLAATRERFGDLLPRLAAEAGRPGPDLDGIERALRDSSHAGARRGAEGDPGGSGQEASEPALRGLRPGDGPSPPRRQELHDSPC